MSFPKPGRCRSVSLATMMILATLFSSAFLGNTKTSAELDGPKAGDRQITLVLEHLLRREHLSKHPLDDEISQRAIGSFLENLDPMKVYFNQSDIDEFMKQSNQLDDYMRKGDLRFAFDVFNRFLQRVDERLGFVERILDQPQDFTTDEEMVTDRDAATYATSDQEAIERWRKRIKYDMLVLKTEEVEGDEAIDRLRRRYSSYAKRMHRLQSDDLIEMFLSSITTSFDPHTSFMSKSTLENFEISMRLNLEGIGAALMMNDGYTVVSKIIPGGAADKHGKLQPEDRIVSVGQGSDGEMVDVIDMNLNEVVELIRGKAGTLVRLGVLPANSNAIVTYKIIREKIELKDSEARGEIISDGTKQDGSPFAVGVIDLPSFYMDMDAARRNIDNFKSTTSDVRRILKDFNKSGVDAVVLDLRRNGGGSLTEAINLTGLFIDQGAVVQVKDSDGNVIQYDDTDRGMAWTGPLVVLTSKFSASASEILAGAIKDYNRGIIVGDETTHGKGTVQSLLNLGSQLYQSPNPPNLGALKITMQQFYRPNGESTQKKGVPADVALPSLTTHMDVGESDLDYPVEFDKIPSASYQKTGQMNPAIAAELNKLSATRRSQSDDFAKLQRNIQRYQQQKERKSVTLNEEKFFAERAELDAEKAEEEELKEQMGDDRPVIDRNFVFDEILNITRDYVNLLEKPKVAAGR
ncbi:MAG: carboxy terminal-processing peptidase [Planctomycetales bacterium]|nr:carboxy terminal-processing peptidase [Planctomycetales bacterium]